MEADWSGPGVGRAELDALNRILWSFFFDNHCRMAWTSRNPAGRLAGNYGVGEWTDGSWQELARIDNLRGTDEDDPGNYWWERLYNHVPAFQRLSPNVGSRNTKGNVVEACCGGSFVAFHELRQRRFHFRTEPPDALAHAAAIFEAFAACGVSHPPLHLRPDYAGIPALIIDRYVVPDMPRVAAIMPKAVSASVTQAAVPMAVSATARRAASASAGTTWFRGQYITVPGPPPEPSAQTSVPATAAAAASAPQVVSASAPEAASASSTQVPASITRYLSDPRGPHPGPDVGCNPKPWSKLVGIIQQSSRTGQFSVHCSQVRAYFFEDPTIDDLPAGLGVGDCVNFQVIFPRSSRGGIVAEEVRRFEGDAAVSAAAASDYAHSRQSTHATPRPRVPPKAAPPALPDAAAAPRQSRPVTPRPRPPKAAPPLLLNTAAPKASAPDSPAAPSNAAASAAAASDLLQRLLVDEDKQRRIYSRQDPEGDADGRGRPALVVSASAPEAASASAPEAVTASAPEAASASGPDSHAGPSDDLLARMEEATLRMEAAARELEAAEQSGRGGGQRGRVWQEKKRQRAEMHRAGRLPPRATQTPMCPNCHKNQPCQYCNKKVCRTCCERIGGACVYHDVG